jgi:hypothetical protein
MLGEGGKHRKVIVSTLREIRGLRPLIEEGLIDEVCSERLRIDG